MRFSSGQIKLSLLSGCPHYTRVQCYVHSGYLSTTNHGVPAWHDLQFSQPRKCSSAVASAVHCTLPDGALRVQEHAPGPALHDSPCAWQHLFTRYEGRQTFRHLPNVSLTITYM